jgi:hypothetical protein
VDDSSSFVNRLVVKARGGGDLGHESLPTTLSSWAYRHGCGSS